jgi:hypothetical protein
MSPIEVIAHAGLWLLVLWLSLRAAYERGLARGRALEWQDRYFDTVKRDRARRDAAGKFKPKATKATAP